MSKQSNLRAVANRKRRKQIRVRISRAAREQFNMTQANREYLAGSMAQDAERVAGMMRALSQSRESRQAAMIWQLVTVGALGVFAILLALKLSS